MRSHRINSVALQLQSVAVCCAFFPENPFRSGYNRIIFVRLDYRIWTGSNGMVILSPTKYAIELPQYQ